MAATVTSNIVPFPAAVQTFARGDEVELAAAAKTAIAPTALGRTELTYDEGGFWRYDAGTGIWRQVPNESINCTISSFAGSPLVTGVHAKALCVSSRQVSGARTILRDELVSDPTRRRFANAVRGLAFANGFVQVVNGHVVVSPHAPDHLARYAYPFDYVPNVPAPQLMRFMHSLFSDVSPAEEYQRIALYQEFAGTCLIGEATTYQRALVIPGEGDNGKSQAITLAQAAFPPGSVVSLPPQMWSMRFQLATLAGVLGNFVHEIPERDITGGEVFKAVITGDPIPGEQKYQAPFTFRPIAGHIFSANTLPGTVDQSSAYWRRFVLLPFTRNMRTAPEHQLSAAKGVIDAELPEVVAWFIDGAARVQRNGRYTVPQSSVEMLDAWRKDADSVLKFAAEECIKDPQGKMKPAELFKDYCHWAGINNFGIMSSTKFFRRFAKAGIERVHTVEGNVYRCRMPGGWRYRA